MPRFLSITLENWNYCYNRNKTVIIYDGNKIFHLIGAIDYGRLGFKHRIMKMFHSMMLKKPESELTADAKAMLETYGKQVDFVDYDGLKPIIEIIG